jgi:hypothetical protein
MQRERTRETEQVPDAAWPYFCMGWILLRSFYRGLSFG